MDFPQNFLLCFEQVKDTLQNQEPQLFCSDQIVLAGIKHITRAKCIVKHHILLPSLTGANGIRQYLLLLFLVVWFISVLLCFHVMLYVDKQSALSFVVVYHQLI